MKPLIAGLCCLFWASQVVGEGPSVIQFQDGITKPELEALINATANLRSSLRIASVRQYPACDHVPEIDLRAQAQSVVKVECEDPFWKRTIRLAAGYTPPQRTPSEKAEPATVTAVILRTSLARGHVLTPDDLEVGQVSTTVNDIYFEKPSDIIGREIIANLSKGQPILSRHLQTNWIIRKGAPVQIIYQRAGINILAPGKALDNGQLGEVIQVTNTASKRQVRGKVVGENKIVVRAKLN